MMMSNDSAWPCTVRPKRTNAAASFLMGLSYVEQSKVDAADGFEHDGRVDGTFGGERAELHLLAQSQIRRAHEFPHRRKAVIVFIHRPRGEQFGGEVPLDDRRQR